MKIQVVEENNVREEIYQLLLYFNLNLFGFTYWKSKMKYLSFIFLCGWDFQYSWKSIHIWLIIIIYIFFCKLEYLVWVPWHIEVWTLHFFLEENYLEEDRALCRFVFLLFTIFLLSFIPSHAYLFFAVHYRYDLSSLSVLGSVGEPINPEAWLWYYKVVGDSNVSIVDTFWQTETGGHVITPLPGATPCKPGSAVSKFWVFLTL